MSESNKMHKVPLTEKAGMFFNLPVIRSILRIHIHKYKDCRVGSDENRMKHWRGVNGFGFEYRVKCEKCGKEKWRYKEFSRLNDSGSDYA